jgi:hypothetical protein
LELPPSPFLLSPENIRAISDKHGERFRLDISPTTKKNSGKWSPNMETLTAKNKKTK